MAECCAHGAHSETQNKVSEAPGTILTDPVCGMKVDTRTAQHRYDLDGTIYVFCGAGCRV